MSDTARLCELLQAQAQLLSIRIAAEGTKEYKADWLKNTDTVVRDGSGRFAKKGASSEVTEAPASEQPPTVKEKVGQAISDTKKVTSLLLEGGEVTVEMLKKLLTDKNFRRRAGLEAGQTGAQAIKRLAEAAKVNPELTKKLDSYINKFNEDLIKEYGDDGGAMAQAIRKHGNLPPGKDLKERLELQVAKYKAYEDALDSPEFYEKEDPKPVQSLQQKIIAASIPIAVSLGVAIVPEVIFAGAAFSLTESLIAFAAGEVGAMTADKVMDKLDINNPVARLGVGLAVGSLTGGTAAMGFKALRAKKAGAMAADNISSLKDSLGVGVSRSKDYLPMDQEFEHMATAAELYDGIIGGLDGDQLRLIDQMISALNHHSSKIEGLSPNNTSLLLKITKAKVELTKKRGELAEIIKEENTKKLLKISRELRAIELKKGSNPKGFQVIKEREDLIRKVNQQSELVNALKSDIAKYYKGWGDSYKQLEDVYREIAVTRNKYNLNLVNTVEDSTEKAANIARGVNVGVGGGIGTLGVKTSTDKKDE